ncbi:MAG: thiol reductant ABC exporter subunit CydC [Anaerolineae bacterium]|nr:thiol reductant ABC exporter subunit CydC [Anaerolineae bacterium]
MLLAAVLGFLTIVSSIALMGSSAYIIARAALQPSIADLQVAIVGVRFFGIARGVLRYLERYGSHETTFRLLARLRVWFYTALEPLAPARLMDYHSGDLLTRIITDIDTLENIFVRVIAPPVVALMVAGAVVIGMSFVNPLLALAVLIVLGLAGVGVPLLTRRLGRNAGAETVRLRADLNAALVDGIQGCADLLAFGREHTQQAHIRRLNQQLINWQRRMAWIEGMNGALVNWLTALATVAVLAIAIPLVSAHQLDGVYLPVLALVTIASFEAVLGLPLAFQYLDHNLAAARRLFEIVDARPEVAVTDANLLPPSHGIVFDNVRFRYGSAENWALDGLSFTVPAGCWTAVIGPSGAGKSTLINLLLRFREFSEGQITIGGVDIRQCNPDLLRQQIAVVSQQTHLFNTTVRENLRIARRDATDDELLQATQTAQLHDFITALPQGYDTWIGEQGLQLSSGQRQRLAIARALLKDAPILILDEATANLDAQTERDILTLLRKVMRQRTVLMITHKLVGLDHADEILVMHTGQIVERGRHAALRQINGLYSRWYEQHHLIAATKPVTGEPSEG